MFWGLSLSPQVCTLKILYISTESLMLWCNPSQWIVTAYIWITSCIDILHSQLPKQQLLFCLTQMHKNCNQLWSSQRSKWGFTLFHLLPLSRSAVLLWMMLFVHNNEPNLKLTGILYIPLYPKSRSTGPSLLLFIRDIYLVRSFI